MDISQARQQLIEYLGRFEFLSEEEKQRFAERFELQRVQKRQFIVQPGFTAQSRHFVAEGAFRAYVVCGNGHDHTISFALENWWITDYNSYIFQQPATQFVLGLEDSYILKIGHEQEAELKSEHLNFERVFRELAERGLAFQQRRLIANLTQSAEARYDDFVSRYPEVLQRIPQYAVASYLGMTTEFFSKIKNGKLRSS